jgi:hypothetical protein
MRWSEIATAHLDEVYDLIEAFNKSLLAHLNIEDKVQVELRERIEANLQASLGQARIELDELWHDEQQQPITYNHYYTDNVQKARVDEAKKLVRRAIQADSPLPTAAAVPTTTPVPPPVFGGPQPIQWGKPATAVFTPQTPSAQGSISTATLFAALEAKIVVNMDEQACVEAIAGLDAYYKVAMKTWVDNVCRQVIERRLLRSLPNIFSPMDVAGYSDEELDAIAGEGHDVVERRARLKEELAILQGGLNDLRR